MYIKIFYFTYTRDINIQTYKAVYSKNPYTPIIKHMYTYIYVFTYFSIMVFT